MFRPQDPEATNPQDTLDRECYNCGATGDLLRCSRCKHAWFCSSKCQKAYWPMHKSDCHANDFAAAIESSEPKFAAWMRKHGKQAVLKDAEVERLERASRAVCGLPSRQEMLESMYGRADPAPKAPTFSAQEWLAMERRQQQEQQQALRLLAATPQQRLWQALPPIPEGMGLECSGYRWTQDLSHVHVHVLLPGHLHPQEAAADEQLHPGAKVRVSISRDSLEVAFAGQPYIKGLLFKQVDPEGCTWYIDTGVLHVHLLKQCRKGRYLKQLPAAESRKSRALPAQETDKPSASYATIDDTIQGNHSAKLVLHQISAASAGRVVPGTAADTFWLALLQRAPAGEQLHSTTPPTAYFFSEYDADECLISTNAT